MKGANKRRIVSNLSSVFVGFLDNDGGDAF